MGPTPTGPIGPREPQIAPVEWISIDELNRRCDAGIYRQDARMELGDGRWGRNRCLGTPRASGLAGPPSA